MQVEHRCTVTWIQEVFKKKKTAGFQNTEEEDVIISRWWPENLGCFDLIVDYPEQKLLCCSVQL